MLREEGAKEVGLLVVRPPYPLTTPKKYPYPLIFQPLPFPLKATLREEGAGEIGLLVVTAKRVVIEGRNERAKGAAKGAGQEEEIKANLVNLIAMIPVTVKSTQVKSIAREVKVGRKIDRGNA
jgi:hypothetical protein